MLPICRFYSITCYWKLTHTDKCVSVSLKKLGLVWFEEIAFRWYILSIATSALSQHTATIKWFITCRSACVFSQRFMSPRMAPFPGVSGFPPPLTKPHTVLKQQELVLQSKLIPPGVLRE